GDQVHGGGGDGERKDRVDRQPVRALDDGVATGAAGDRAVRERARAVCQSALVADDQGMLDTNHSASHRAAVRRRAAGACRPAAIITVPVAPESRAGPSGQLATPASNAERCAGVRWTDCTTPWVVPSAAETRCRAARSTAPCTIE